MSEVEQENLDAAVQDDVSADSDNNDTLNEETASDAKYESQKTRAEKAEAKVKELKDSIKALDAKDEPSTDKKEDEQPLQKGLSREEAILIARGLTDKEVSEAVYVSERENITLEEAVTHPRYTAWKDSNDQKAKSEKASLGTSKGSPQFKEKKDLDSTGLSRDEHKALFDARNK